MSSSRAFNFLVKSLSMMLRNGIHLNEKFVEEYASGVASAFASEEPVTITAIPIGANQEGKIAAIKVARDILNTGLAETKYFFDGTGSLKARASQIIQLDTAVRPLGYEIRLG